MLSIDLNCDMGESFGLYKMGQDDQILPYVSSVNIACGFHAGDPSVMRKTVRMAAEQKVAIGAHPGFLDLQGFGRRNMDVSPEEVFNYVVYQVGALTGFVKAEGLTLHHVKPHGALYNMAARNYRLAIAIARAVYAIDPTLILYGLSGSELIRAGKEVGLKTASEIFADRTYQADGSLTPRNHPDALITVVDRAVEQVIQMVQHGTVKTLQGSEITIQADTVCIHGDGEHAVEFAKQIHKRLHEANIRIQTMN
jgi:5-oxoprolinase (ATP-hydrolysing) subunit A